MTKEAYEKFKQALLEIVSKIDPDSVEEVNIYADEGGPIEEIPNNHEVACSRLAYSQQEFTIEIKMKPQDIIR
jgi:hypothetical protein